MINTTITLNRYGIDKFSGTVNAVNTIITGNNGGDLSGGFNVFSGNFIGGSSLLAPLGANGGTR